jgi:hypothetical protein|nr:hypothetical protein [uncultured Campylobacter sp.]
MKKISNKSLEEALNNFVNTDDREYIKKRCLETIFKTQMSNKKYVEFIRKTFEFDVSLSEISTWKKEFDELQNVPTQNEVTKDGDISQQQSNGN